MPNGAQSRISKADPASYQDGLCLPSTYPTVSHKDEKPLWYCSPLGAHSPPVTIESCPSLMAVEERVSSLMQCSAPPGVGILYLLWYSRTELLLCVGESEISQIPYKKATCKSALSFHRQHGLLEKITFWGILLYCIVEVF